MASFISVPSKKGYDVDLVKPLNNLISSYYSSCDQQVDLSGAIEKINQLRAFCVSKTLDHRHESALEAYQKYYDSIVSLESKCPPNELSISFKWKDAFEKASGFLMSIGTMSISNLQYEKACVLFNIGAIASQIAVSQITDAQENDQIRKQIAKNFQLASGVFQALKHLVPTLGKELTPDLNVDLLNWLHLFMLAQAQEIFYFKASSDKLKPALLAKIAMQCSNYYYNALQAVPSYFPKTERDSLPIVKAKGFFFEGVAEFQQSRVCAEQKSFGEQIARLEKANEFFLEIEKKCNTQALEYLTKPSLAKTQRLLAEVRKDNDFIYHEMIPKYENLERIGTAPIAKATSLPERFLPALEDPFTQLMPLPVQQAVHKLDVRKQDLVNNELTNLRELQQLLNGVLASLNLPASLEDTQGKSLPPSLCEKAEKMRAMGGVQAIRKRINEIPSEKQRNVEILDEIELQINNEEESDRRLREQFGESWNRTSSEKLNTYWKNQVEKYRVLLQNGSAADDLLRKKFAENETQMTLLCEDQQKLCDELPESSSTNSSLIQKSNAANELRQLMEQVRVHQSELDKLEQELKKPPTSFDDMKSKFLEALAADGQINEQVLSVEALGEVYAPIQKKVREARERQEQLIEKIRVANQEFLKIKFSGSGEDNRDKYLANLAKAYDMFLEINKNNKEGSEFYSGVTKLLVNLQSKVNDFCFARKAEKTELLNDLSSSRVQRNETSTPPKPTLPEPPSQATPMPTPSSSNVIGPFSQPQATNTSTAYHSTPVPQGAPQQNQPAPYLPYPTNPYTPNVQPYQPNPYTPYSYPYYVPGQYPTASYPQYMYNPSQPPPPQGNPGYPQGNPGYPSQGNPGYPPQFQQNQPYPQQPPHQ